MSRTIESIDLSEKLHYVETISGTATTVTYLPIRKDSDGVLLLRDTLLAAKRINATNDSTYISSEMDTWLNDTSSGYLSYFDDAMRNAIISTSVKVMPYGESTATTIARQAFLLSASEVGGAVSDYGDEGDSMLAALKTHKGTTADTTARIAYPDGSTSASYWWLRSASSAARVRNVNNYGGFYDYNASNTSCRPRPAFKVRNGTMVSDQGEDTIWILPEGTTMYKEIDFAVNMGSTAKRPKKAKVQIAFTNAQTSTIKISNNAKDASPVWVECENNGVAELANTTKTTDNWELGVKVYAKSINSVSAGEPILMVECEK